MKPVERVMPKCFEKLTKVQLLIFQQILQSDHPPQEKRDLITIRFLKLQPWQWQKMTRGQMDELNEITDYLFKPIASKKLVLDHFNYRGVTYYGPGDDWCNLICDEMDAVDRAQQAYLSSNDVSHLNLFMHLLYRPASEESKKAFKEQASDIRIPFNDRIARTSTHFNDLPLYIKMAALTNFIAYRTYVHANNKFLFKSGTSSEVNFGWMGIIHSLAGDKLGTIEKVGESSFNNTLFILKKMESDRIALENNKPQTNNNAHTAR